MEMSQLKEGETTARIVPGPNGISFDSEERVKYIGDSSTHNHKNAALCNENYRAPARDVSFSSYLVGSNAEQISITSLNLGNSVDNQTKEEASASIEGGNIGRPAFVKGLERQNTCNKRVQVLGKVKKDSEISIFEAEKYFSSQNEKKTDANHQSTTQSLLTRENSISKAKIQASKNKLLLSSHDLYDSSNPISSPASSIVVVNRSFRPGGPTPTSSSEASWNSQSGLLSRTVRNSLYKSPVNDRQKASRKCVFGCKWPCSNKKSLEIDDTLKDFKRPPSVSNSLNSTPLMESPVSSMRYSYPRLGRSIEKQSSEAFVDNASYANDLNSSTNAGSVINPLAKAGDRDLQSKLHRNSGKYDKDSDDENSRERRDQRKITGNSFDSDAFSFPILHLKSPEKTRPSLEVFGSPFPGTPHSEETGNSTSGKSMPHLIQPSDLHKRLVLFSLDKARNSFTFNSSSEIHKFGAQVLEDGDQDKESDSSSDLFEIESFTTQGTACYPMRRRKDSVDDIQSGYPANSCELGFNKSYHFGGMEEPAATLSGQNCCYEPSEASMDWSVTTGDTTDKASLGNSTSDHSEMKMINRRASLQSSDLPGLREATAAASMKRKSSAGSFLGCASEKAVSVASPTDYNIRYNYEQRGSSGPPNRKI